MRQREEAFLSRYDALLRWAYSLTNDHVEAEALMQDCYALFVTANTNALSEDLDAYLRRMLSNIRQSNLMRQPDKAAPLSVSKSSENRMFGQDKVNTAETERSRRQIVGDAYTWLWDLFWLPVRSISKLILPAWRQRKTQ